ncbi:MULTISPECIES: hypothetical protein [unclassified Beijerinckia]|uniref:hypothetical protein n=1 Tax=unclassified Beijerinckia TaxID=2638183 RepID=UPI001479AC7E|nr:MULTISPECIES: hypothetical protein [unclassified Beijerinckia]MDH7795336.1 hypothetical protein [Beijerinckia sp. GAS462]
MLDKMLHGTIGVNSTDHRLGAADRTSGEGRAARGAVKFVHGTDPARGDLSTMQEVAMIRKLKSGEYRLYSRKLDPKTHKRRNLGTFKTRGAAEKHEREVQYFKRH